MILIVSASFTSSALIEAEQFFENGVEIRVLSSASCVFEVAENVLVFESAEGVFVLWAGLVVHVSFFFIWEYFVGAVDKERDTYWFLRIYLLRLGLGFYQGVVLEQVCNMLFWLRIGMRLWWLQVLLTIRGSNYNRDRVCFSRTSKSWTERVFFWAGAAIS